MSLDSLMILRHHKKLVKKKYQVVSFVLNNRCGTRCHISAWGDEVTRVEPLLALNKVRKNLNK